MKKIIFPITITIFTIIAVFLFFPQKTVFSLYAPNAPNDLKEAKNMGDKFLSGFPGAMKNIWQEVKAFAQKPISWLKVIWQKIVSFLDKEVEKRKPEIKEEFQKEKQEMKEDIPKVTKSLWEKLKELTK